MKTQKKVILFILPNLLAGGYERVTLNIIRNLDKKKFDINLLLLEKKGYFTQLIPSYVYVYNLKKNRARKTLPGIIKILIHLKPEIVFSTANRVNIIVLLTTFVYKSKIIIREPNLPKAQIDNKILTPSYIFMMRLLYPRASKIITQTDEMKIELEEIFHLNNQFLQTIRNPIDYKLIEDSISGRGNPYMQGRINILTIGRINYQKGLDVLVKAFGIVVKYDKRFVLYVIGEVTDQKYMEELKEVIVRLNLEKNVIFLGFIKNPYIYLKYADLFVLSSRWEGMPNVILEALYLKKPIVTTRCIKDINRIFKNNQDSLVDIEDVDSLAEKIINYKNICIVDDFHFENKYNSFFEKI